MKNLKIYFILFMCFPVYMSGNVSLILPNVTGAHGTQVTVPVKVKDFLTIISCQGTIQFDQTKVSYVSVQDFGLPGMNASSFGTTQVSSGKLTFLWYDGTLAGVNLADSAVIFSVTFNLIGNEGQTSALTFIDTPTQVEIVDVNFNTVTANTVNGSIYIHNTTSVTLSLDNVTGTAGSQVSVSLRPNDFTNIISLQGTIQFDPAYISFSSVSTLGLQGMSSSNFGMTQVSSGILTFNWNDVTLAGINVSDGDPLFTITFNILCNTGTSAISLTNSPVTVGVTDSLSNSLITVENAGGVNVQALTISASAAPATICVGQTVVLTATGAVSYSWTPGNLTGSSVDDTPNSTTTYTVTGTTNGCNATAFVTVTVNPLPTVSAGNDQNVCQGEQVILNGSGATSYTWDNSVVNNVAFTPPLGTTTYTVTGTDGGCTNTDQAIITVNPLPSVSCSLSFDTLCNDAGLVVLTGGLPAGGFYSGNGVSSGNFDPSASGLGIQTITYTYTDGNNCLNSAVQSVYVDDCTWLKDNNIENFVLIYPNPVQTTFDMVFANDGLVKNIKIFNAFGKEVFNAVTSDSKMNVNIDNYLEGIYIIQVKSDFGIARRKIIKSKS